MHAKNRDNTCTSGRRGGELGVRASRECGLRSRWYQGAYPGTSAVEPVSPEMAGADFTLGTGNVRTAVVKMRKEQTIVGIKRWTEHE